MDFADAIARVLLLRIFVYQVCSPVWLWLLFKKLFNLLTKISQIGERPEQSKILKHKPLVEIDSKV